MEQNGYYQSRISDEEQPQVETQQMNVVFHIVAGPHARVGRMTVTGPAGFLRIGRFRKSPRCTPGTT